MCSLHLTTRRVLEKLQVEAIHFAQDLRSRRDPLDLTDFERDTKDLMKFHKEVNAHRETLGDTRIVRILRHNTPAVRGLDKNKAAEPNLEDCIRCVEGILTNIEHELEVIERRMIFILTVAAVVAATAAAIASVIALFKQC